MIPNQLTRTADEPDDLVLRIVSAAVCKNGKVYTGRRHGLIIPAVVADTGERVSQDEQGFIANDGKFYNRFQSGAIAFMAGQTKTRKEFLLSEDVW